jgi:hypothetical protein
MLHNPKVEVLDDLCRERGTLYESLICGYLRQPILVDARRDSVRVGGLCAITDHACRKKVVDGEQKYVVLECPVYRARYSLP